MPISRDEAASALQEIERTESLSHRLQSYAGASPHFMLWGLVWMFGYALSEVVPDSRNLIWATGIAIGAVTSVAIGRSQAGATARSANFSPWRYAAISGGIAMFFGIASMILKFDAREIDAFIPLMFSGMYLLAGLYVGARFAVCGAILAAAVATGYVNAGDHFGLWMAAFGGGILMLTGLWLRRA
jgi:hypothetical protein